MTPEERVNALWRKWQTTPLTSLKALMAEELAAAVKDEREACAQIADDAEQRWLKTSDEYPAIACEDIAAAIRDRTP